MTNQNVELVQRLFDAYARRDLDAVFACLHPEIEIRVCELLPWGGEYRGFEGVREFLTAFIGQVDSHIQTDQVIESGDHVVQIGRTKGTVRVTGAEFDVAEVQVIRVRDGLVIRFEVFNETGPMLVALGQPA